MSPEKTTEDLVAILVSHAPDMDHGAALEMLVSCDGSVDKCLELMGISRNALIKRKGMGIQSTLGMFTDPDDQLQRKTKVPRLDRKGKTVHVYDPKVVENLLPCTLHFNVFPNELAEEMLQTLMKDAETWHYSHFYLFDREVQAGHSSCIYSSDMELVRSRNATYNGRRASDIRPFNAALTKGRDIVQKLVNEQIGKRGRSRYQYPGPWSCDVAVVNKYANRTESVGWHSDQMTHIGPDAVIASVSLGVTREFRLKNKFDNDMSTVSVHLPHNSLVIMHAGCQEEWKHSVVPLSVSPEPHEISGDARINITYRMYLDDFKVDKVPSCECGKPMILRTTVKKSRANDYKYIWQCSQSYLTGKGCFKTIYPKFTDNTVQQP
jgi:hypothetical protein